MSKDEAEHKGARRDPQRHRQALIAATLDLISEIGIPETTVSRIIDRAGLSRGMIHLHFGGKDKLLIAAAETFSADYTAELERQLAAAGPRPEDVVLAVIRADLGEALLNERAARIWHAFRGIANPSPEIAEQCGTRDGLAREEISEAFATLAAENEIENAEAFARDATFGTLALLEGMCVDYLSNTETFSRSDAERIILRFIAGLFPAQFG